MITSVPLRPQAPHCLPQEECGSAQYCHDGAGNSLDRSLLEAKGADRDADAEHGQEDRILLGCSRLFSLRHKLQMRGPLRETIHEGIVGLAKPQ